MTKRRLAPPRIPRPRGRRWVAERDGIAHLASNHPLAIRRTPCGLPAAAERFAWPIARYCPTCLAEAEVLMASA